MAAYIVASIKIRDREGYARYEAGFMDVFSKYEGELVAVSETAEVLEGEWPYTRAVLLRFPDRVAAKAWYESPEYQQLAAHRRDASEGVIIAVDAFV